MLRFRPDLRYASSLGMPISVSPSSGSKTRGAAAMAALEVQRQSFRESLAAEPLPKEFSSRVGVVLSGGGARGAYEAGVLMAFQDAAVPTTLLPPPP